MNCFALLDDASAADPQHARSRLYSGHTGTLVCQHVDDWAGVLEQMQQALARGLYAVPALSYELGGHLLGIDAHPLPGPLGQVLLFDTCTHLSPPEVAAWLAARGDSAPAGIAAITPNVDEAQFTSAINAIHDYIEAGHTYQVNYTYRLRFDAFGSLFALYARLRARQPVPYGALVGLPDGSALLSLSPELFVRHHDGELLTRPMKGTAPATDDDADNTRRAQALAADSKNRAENLMIVDLLRNDLGRVAVTGSVDVPALFDVQRYSSVLQMTSTVRAQLRPEVQLADIFSALYPCGSITGAPKRRTMEIIRELEPAPRGVYTGAIGWFDPPQAGRSIGDFCLSVPIRTLTLQPENGGVRKGEMGVGAGIVFDSVAAEEFAECQLKARFLTGLPNEFELFETMQVSARRCPRLAQHLARLSASARYFGFRYDAHAISATVNGACAALGEGTFRMRLGLAADGTVSLQTAPLLPLAQPVKLVLAQQATSSRDLFLRHKTSIRTVYDEAWRAAEAQGAFDALFFNERGELTEGGRSNVFVKFGERWYTPPLSCGVLPGVLRAAILADPLCDVTEGVITAAMLTEAVELMVCNGLRGAMRATLVR